ncbi:MAG: CHRD domain-containing protein [Acidimicrobiia bacterium]
MSRNTRNRALLVGLAAVTLGASTLGGLASARSDGYGADRLARGDALAVALDAYTEAVMTCDIDTARVAYEEAEMVFNAVEIDHQFASPERYNFFEHIYIQDQVPSGLGLEGDEPYDCATNTRLAEEQAAAWDEVVAYLAASPPETTLLDDVAVLRGVNQGIRRARAEIDGNPDATPQTPATEPNPAAAAEHWAEFVADYPVARELIAFRNEELATEIDGLMAAVSTAFEGDPATGFPNASAALAALAPRYGLGINLVTAAARNSIPSESTQAVFDPDAFSSADFLGDLVITFFEMRDLIAAGTPEAAAQVQVEYTDWIQYPLQFKTGGALTRANVAFETALAAYMAEQNETTTKALLDALLIVEQVFVGQYWGTPELVQYYEENEEPGGEPVPATFVATLTPEANIPPGPAGATGDATIEIDADAGQVCQVISHENTGAPLTLAHIHEGDAGVNGPVVVDLQVLPSGQEACSDANPAVLREIVANPGGFYVNLHTDDFPNGVLRGPLSPAAPVA